MKPKFLAIAAFSAMTLMALTASSAMATTLEVGGTAKNEKITVEATLASGTSGLLSTTGGGFANTCTKSTVTGSTEGSFTGTTVGGPISTLSVSSCSLEASVVDSGGSFTIEHISGTTSGTVRSTGAKITAPSPFGGITCTTNNTDIGTLTGTKEGNATLDINAVINCGFLIPSAKLTATYTVTSPAGLGVTS